MFISHRRFRIESKCCNSYISNLFDNAKDAVAQYTSYAVAAVKNELNVYVSAELADGVAKLLTPAGVAPLLPVPANTSAAVGAVAPLASVTHRTCSAKVMVSVTVATVPAVSPFFVGCEVNPLLYKSNLVPNTLPLTVEQ